MRSIRTAGGGPAAGQSCPSGGESWGARGGEVLTHRLQVSSRSPVLRGEQIGLVQHEDHLLPPACGCGTRSDGLQHPSVGTIGSAPTCSSLPLLPAPATILLLLLLPRMLLLLLLEDGRGKGAMRVRARAAKIRGD